MSNMTNEHTARIIRGQYGGGTPYFVVRCDACNLVLNSGHHYPLREQSLAQGLADRHNAEEH